jgi:hypothetical protein
LHGFFDAILVGDLNMMQLSIVLFFGLFAIVEIYQSVKNVQLPMPVYLVLGIMLAIASNAAKYLPASPENIAEAELVKPEQIVSELTTLQTHNPKQVIPGVD